LVAATEGATASYFAELARRATLLAAVAAAGAGDGRVPAADGTPGGAEVRAALAELRASQDAIAAQVRGE
jgi:hypothetical protein